MASGIVNPANAVTALRGLTLFPIWYFIDQGDRQYALALLVVGALMDLVDGWVAKFFDCQTSFGAIFDAVTDAVLYGALILLVTVYGWAPWWPVVLIMGLGAFNTVARFVYARRAGRTVNYRSIAMEHFTGTLAFMIGFALADYEPGFYFPLYAGLMGLIVAHDAKRMLLDPVAS